MDQTQVVKELLQLENLAQAFGEYAIAAGHNPQANGPNSVALGRAAKALDSSSVAIGYHPTSDAKFGVALGNYAYANGINSVAIGYRSWALHDGSFVHNDFSTPGPYLESTADNQFMVKAAGGSVFYTSSDLSTGVVLPAGAGAWSMLSDRNSKENIESIDPQEFLDFLENIEVYEWSYKSQDSTIRHIGPMAQDFQRAFGIGTDSTRINSGDFDGVNMILIKALIEKVDELEKSTRAISFITE